MARHDQPGEGANLEFVLRRVDELLQISATGIQYIFRFGKQIIKSGT